MLFTHSEDYAYRTKNSYFRDSIALDSETGSPFLAYLAGDKQKILCLTIWTELERLRKNFQVKTAKNFRNSLIKT